MSDGEIERIRGWLTQEGYPLEYEAARISKEASFRVFQGLFFEDPESAPPKPREIDVLAVREAIVMRRPATRCGVYYAIECKSNSKPWLVLKGNTKGGRLEGLQGALVSTIRGVDVLAGFDETDPDPWLLRMPDACGFSVVQTHRKGNDLDPAYGALRSVTKAARAILETPPPAHPVMALPVVVLGGGLCNLRYDDEGTESLTPSGWERVLWRGTRVAGPVMIDVVQRESLRDYAHLASDAADELLPVLRSAYIEASRSDRLKSPEGVGGRS